MLTIALAVALSFTLAFSSTVLAQQKGEMHIEGTLYCVDATGIMHLKTGVCPAEHLAHVLITADGRAVVLGGGENADKLIRKQVVPVGAKEKVKGQMIEGVPAMKVKDITQVEAYKNPKRNTHVVACASDAF